MSENQNSRTEKKGFGYYWRNPKKRIIITYSLGEMSYAMYAGFLSAMQNMFLTDVVGVKALVVGGFNVFSRILKIATSPLTGILFDKRIFRVGKYWPWTCFATGLALIVALAQFVAPMFVTGPNLPKVVLLIILLGNFMDSVVFTSYSAIFPTVTDVQSERVLASTIKNLARVFGTFLQGIYFPIALGIFAGEKFGGKTAAGYMYTFLSMAIVSYLIYLVASREIKVSGMEEKDIYTVKKDKVPLKDLFVQLFTNFPLLIVFLMQITFSLRTASFNPMLPYYYKYVAGSMTYYSIYQSFNTLISVVFIVLTPFITKLLRGAKYAYAFVIGIATVCHLSMWFVRDNVLIFTLFLALAVGIGNIASGLSLTFFTAAADYGEWKRGNQCAGLSMSAYQLAIQLANMIGAMAVGVVLNNMGYVQGMEMTTAVKDSITMTMIKLPTIATAAAMIIGMFMPLTDKKMAQVQRDLEERRAAADAVTSNAE